MNEGQPTPKQRNRLTRRDFLKLTGVVGGGVTLSELANRGQGIKTATSILGEMWQRLLERFNSTPISELVDKSKNVKLEQLAKEIYTNNQLVHPMLDNLRGSNFTEFGSVVDGEYSASAGFRQIQASQTPEEKILRTLFYLGINDAQSRLTGVPREPHALWLNSYEDDRAVRQMIDEENKKVPPEKQIQYNKDEFNKCDAFAQMMAMLLTRDDKPDIKEGWAISHYVDGEGKPLYVGEDFFNVKVEHSINDARKILDWLQNYGEKYGWTIVSVDDLTKNGQINDEPAENYVIFAVTNYDSQPSDFGHNAILTKLFGKWYISQSTNNTFLKEIEDESNAGSKWHDYRSKYMLFAHQITTNN